MTTSAPTVPVEAFRVPVRGITLSGLVARVERPRAVLLALHGGGSRADYFHDPALPEQSLLLLAAEQGYTAVALDRPGYAASLGQVDGLSTDERADLVAAALPVLLDDLGAGVVLVAHSLGTQLAVRLAGRWPAAIGLEFSGNGLEYRTPTPFQRASDPAPGRRAFEVIWGDVALYPDGALTRERTRASAGPADEGIAAAAWRHDLPGLAAAVRVPVRVTVAEHEAVWSLGPAALAELAATFTAAPRVHAVVQPEAPHNMSLSRAARAYHLHVVGFAEECVLRAGRIRSHPPKEDRWRSESSSTSST